jgi:hypothetical protein
MPRNERRSRPALALRAAAALSATALAAATLAAPAAARPKPTKRYGLEGEVVRFDDARDVLVVKVTRTQVAGLPGGNTVGGPAPDSIKRLSEVEFSVEPEGSVLRRTVVKARTGGGLDNSGTRDGFRRALAAIPNGRSVIFSFEENEPAAVAKGEPDYRLRLIQIQMTEDEIRRRFEQISVEE